MIVLAVPVLVALLAAGVVAAVRMLQWPPGWERNVLAKPDIARDFSADERDRAQRFQAALSPLRYIRFVVPVVVACGLGLTPLGAWLVAGAAIPFGGGWLARALVAGPVLVAVTQVISVPVGVAVERVMRRFELSRRGWGLWIADQARSYVVGAILAAVVTVAGYGLLRWSPNWWWLALALVGAVAAVVMSVLAPLVLEPLFNRFQPLPDGPLRRRLLELAAMDRLTVGRVLVADASRRTRALNAYVSGIGATRRIVIYDTLLERAEPVEIELVVAHELGHAVHRDVRQGTVLAALAAAAVGPALAVVAATVGAPLLTLAGVASMDDPAGVPLVVALAMVAGTASAPIQNFVSRRIESRADEHALRRTGDVEAFIAMQRRLAITNIASLNPSRLAIALFGSHPSIPARIAHAREFAARTDR